MVKDLRDNLAISAERLEDINAVLLNPETRMINDFLDVVAKYGTPDEINTMAQEASQLPTLLKKVEATKPEYLEDLQWLEEQRKDEIIASGDWENLTLNYLDKVDATNRTAWALTENGLSFIAATNLHR